MWVMPITSLVLMKHRFGCYLPYGRGQNNGTTTKEQLAEHVKLRLAGICWGDLSNGWRWWVLYMLSVLFRCWGT